MRKSRTRTVSTISFEISFDRAIIYILKGEEWGEGGKNDDLTL